MKNADPDKVSSTAKNRGLTQIGTLGSGNHFLEIQKVDKIFNPETAKVFRHRAGRASYGYDSLRSRGYGHQVCSDYLRVMEHAVQKYKIDSARQGTRMCTWKQQRSEGLHSGDGLRGQLRFLQQAGYHALGAAEFPAGLP